MAGKISRRLRGDGKLVGDELMEKIPGATFALISGSASWGIRFPEDLEEPGFHVSRRDIVFDTPWGPSQGWKLIDIDGTATADGQPRRILNLFAMAGRPTGSTMRRTAGSPGSCRKPASPRSSPAARPAPSTAPYWPAIS